MVYLEFAESKTLHLGTESIQNKSVHVAWKTVSEA